MRTNLFAIIMLGLFYLTSCDDLIEPDISDKAVVLVTPTNNAALKKAIVAFRWEEVAGARTYRLQIASPSLELKSEYFIDTTVSTTTVSMPLQPGNYEWRVQALNSAYKTGYISQAFVLDSTSNLSGSELRLLSPENNFSSNKQKIQFSWSAITLADKYIFEIISPVKFDTVVYSTSFSKNFPKESKGYEWRVRALNVTGVVTSSARRFNTDYDVPEVPAIRFPQADTTIFTWPITLKWSRQALDVEADSLFLYHADQSRLVSNFPKKITNSYFVLPGSLSLAPGNYYWSIKSFDKAGNTSKESGKSRFIVR